MEMGAAAARASNTKMLQKAFAESRRVEATESTTTILLHFNTEKGEHKKNTPPLGTHRVWSGLLCDDEAAPLQ